MEELFGSDDESVNKGNTQVPEKDPFGSDSDSVQDNIAETVDAAVKQTEEEDLFGSDDEHEGGANEQNEPAPDKDKQDDLDGLFGSDDEAPVTQAKVCTQSVLSLPTLRKTIPLGAFGVAGTMPSFVKIQPRPFVPEEHSRAEEEQRFEGAIDIIRWRYKRDSDGELVMGSNGKPFRESNARMVKWSDGSFQLIVGSTVFQAEMLSVHDSYGYAQLKSEQTGDGDDANEAVRARSQQSCLNSIGKIDYKVKILPSSVHSDAHTRMSLKVTEKYLTGATSRQIGYKHHATIRLDPEKEMEERIKAEEAELRKIHKRKMEESGVGVGRKKYSAMSARYLEEGADDEGQYDSTSLAHLKRGGKRGRDYGSSDEDSGDNRRYSRSRGAKSDPDGEMDDFIVNDDDEEGGSDEYEEKDYTQKSRIKKKLAEDEDDDEDDDDVFDDAEEVISDEEEDDVGDDADVVASAKGPVRSKRMIIDSDDEG